MHSRATPRLIAKRSVEVDFPRQPLPGNEPAIHYFGYEFANHDLVQPAHVTTSSRAPPAGPRSSECAGGSSWPAVSSHSYAIRRV